MKYKTSKYKQRTNEERINRNNQKKFEKSIEPISPRYFANHSDYVDRTPEQNEIKDKVYGLLEKLEAKKGIKYRIAAEQYYLQDRTMEDIGKMVHLSYQRVAQLRDEVLTYLNFLAKRERLEHYVVQEKN